MDAFTRAARAGIKPDQQYELSEWADLYRHLPGKSAAEPGKYRTSRTPYMREIMDALSPHSGVTEVVFMKGTQLGAPLDLDTAIPTSTGWTTMENISPGETVFDEAGKPCTVYGVSPVFHGRTCYELTFSDGAQIVADEDHLWTVRDLKARKLPHKTIRTGQIFLRMKKGDLAQGRNRFAIPVGGPLNLPRLDLPIDPYLLGLWIGDGHSGAGMLTMGLDDLEVVNILSEMGIPNRIAWTSRDHGRVLNIKVMPIEICGVGNTFHAMLKRQGLIKNKHIPKRYMRASEGQRRALLQGIMDSDGSVTEDGRCEVSATDGRIARQIVELLLTLGLKPTTYYRPEKAKKIGGRPTISKEATRISFTAYKKDAVFRQSRKTKRLKSDRNGRPSESGSRWITGIRKVKSRPVRCIAVTSASQLFLAGHAMIPTHNSECGNNWILYTIDVSPCSMMAVFPTQELAKTHSKQRLGPAIEDTPRLKEKIKARAVRDGENTILSKSFPGGFLYLLGSNSGTSFRSRPVKNVFLDDIDGFELIPGEGDPISLATRRTDSFGARRKIYYNSTPTVRGESFIEKVFEASDQRHYYVPCPRCGEFQMLAWGGKDTDFGVKFAWDSDKQITDVWYECEHCHGRIEEHEKTEMLAGGRWVPDFPERTTRRGYQLSSLYSPVGWVSWKRIVEEFLEARRDPQKLKVWTNTREGIPFEDEGEQPDWTELKARAEGYQLRTAPAGVRRLTAGVDVMDTFLSYVVLGWGFGEEAWVVDYGEIFGDPNEEDVWRQLDGVLDRYYDSEDGGKMRIDPAGIDTGGHCTQAVYRYARRKGPFVMASKGANVIGAPIIKVPSKQDVAYFGQIVPHGIQLWSIGVDVAKSTIYSRLGIPALGPGYMHFPIGLPDQFYQELTAEKRAERVVKGYLRHEWIQVRRSNHALDCVVLAYAAAVRAGVDKILDDPPPEPRRRDRQTSRPRQTFTGGGKGWLKTGGKKWI